MAEVLFSDPLLVPIALGSAGCDVDWKGFPTVTDVARSRTRRALIGGVVALTLGACAGTSLAGIDPPPTAPGIATDAPRLTAGETDKHVCAYSYHRIRQLTEFGTAAGRDFDCALVYNNASPDWANWERPWFVIHGDPNFNWANWKNAAPGRRLIITQALIPSGLTSDWRARGASGQFDDHDRALATNLVAAGIGDSIIRLSHEANGTWTLDGLGNDPARYGSWKAFWARTVRVMRSVPGAHFRFDWTINAPYRAIPFDEYYPGDDVVDIVGADVYDFWAGPGPAPTNPIRRWRAQYDQAGGLGALIQYGKLHGKPLSIPEWGISAVGSKGGAGDNAYFVDAMAGVVANNVTAYHSYFESKTDVNMLLTDAPRSLAAYRRHFGSRGDLVG